MNESKIKISRPHSMAFIPFKDSSEYLKVKRNRKLDIIYFDEFCYVITLNPLITLLFNLNTTNEDISHYYLVSQFRRIYDSRKKKI